MDQVTTPAAKYPALSSLDRLVQSGELLWFGGAPGRSAVKGLRIGGTVHAGIAALFASLSMMGVPHGAQTAFLIQAPIFAFSAISMHLGAWGMKRRMRQMGQTDVPLTKEARALLNELLRHRVGKWGRRCSDLMDARTFEAANAAAFEYNRIRAALAAAEESPDPTLLRFIPTIRNAANKTIAAVLHHTALARTYPESEAPFKAIMAEVASLREAADKVESLHVQPASIAAAAGHDELREVLQQLRLVEGARAELEQPIRGE